MNIFRSQKKWKDIKTYNQKRIETLFDAVIAIAMTMMALEISIPVTESFDWNSLLLLMNEITVYLISFIALASVWVMHVVLFSAFSEFGNIFSILINIVLMFLVTIFPILTKLMASFEKSMLLYVIYLCCYALMECILIISLVMAGRQTMEARKKELEQVSNLLAVRHDPGTEKIQQKCELAKRYLFDKGISKRMFQEFILTLPEPVQMQMFQQKIEQKKRYFKIICFGVTAFLVVVLSIAVLIIHPFCCYPIIAAGIICYFIAEFLVRKYIERKDVLEWE